jgi:hypothetical protein
VFIQELNATKSLDLDSSASALTLKVNLLLALIQALNSLSACKWLRLKCIVVLFTTWMVDSVTGA